MIFLSVLDLVLIRFNSESPVNAVPSCVGNGTALILSIFRECKSEGEKGTPDFDDGSIFTHLLKCEDCPNGSIAGIRTLLELNRTSFAGVVSVI